MSQSMRQKLLIRTCVKRYTHCMNTFTPLSILLVVASVNRLFLLLKLKQGPSFMSFQIAGCGLSDKSNPIVNTAFLEERKKDNGISSEQL